MGGDYEMVSRSVHEAQIAVLRQRAEAAEADRHALARAIDPMSETPAAERSTESLVAWADGLREQVKTAEAARVELLLLNADQGNALAEMQERYRWRPITEIREDYGDCVLINVADVGDIQIGSNLDHDFDISRWTHFSRIAPLSGDDYGRMVVDALTGEGE